MSTSRLDLLRWQLDLTWSLFEYHLGRLEPADLTWAPADVHWTMHLGPDGAWTPDWSESEDELDPVPAPTVAWLTWHLGWWLSVATDHAAKAPPRDRADIAWPGGLEATVAWLREIHRQWRDALERLDDADLDAPVAFPWGEGTEHRLGHMLAWVNTELAKNVSEIGLLRLVRAASR